MSAQNKATRRRNCVDLLEEMRHAAAQKVQFYIDSWAEEVKEPADLLHAVEWLEDRLRYAADVESYTKALKLLDNNRKTAETIVAELAIELKHQPLNNSNSTTHNAVTQARIDARRYTLGIVAGWLLSDNPLGV